MYMFGGYISDKADYNKNLYCLDLDKMEWQIAYEAKGSANEPPGRSNFDMVSDGTHVWIFGGIQDHNNMEDFWKFDMKLKKWDKVESKNTPEVKLIVIIGSQRALNDRIQGSYIFVWWNSGRYKIKKRCVCVSKIVIELEQDPYFNQQYL